MVLIVDARRFDEYQTMSIPAVSAFPAVSRIDDWSIRRRRQSSSTKGTHPQHLSAPSR